MSKDNSFDIVSDFDKQEMTNALDQAKRELENRYDFKGTSSEVDYNENKDGLIVNADSDYRVDMILDILESKMVKRNIPIKVLDKTGVKETAAGGTVRMKVPFIKGLDQEKAKKITKLVREEYPKAKTQVQGEAVRVTSSSRDDLQAIIALVKSAELDFPVQFENYR